MLLAIPVVGALLIVYQGVAMITAKSTPQSGVSMRDRKSVV